MTAQVKKGEIEVRQRGGTLGSKWTMLYLIVDKQTLSYYASVKDSKEKKTTKFLIKVEEIIDVHCVKNKEGDGFVFEIKSGNKNTPTKTQHLCKTNDDRHKWVTVLVNIVNKEPVVSENEGDDADSSSDVPKKTPKDKDNKDDRPPSSRSRKKTAENPVDTPTKDYSNDSGTMVISRTPKSTVKKKDDVVDSNNSGTMVISKPKGKSKPDEYNTGTMVISSQSLAQEQDINTMTQKEKETFFLSLSNEELKEWKESKLLKHHKKEYSKIIDKWKEEKSLILDALRHKEVETIENKYQELQLQLERERQEKKESLSGNFT